MQRETTITKIKMCMISGAGMLEESDWAGVRVRNSCHKWRGVCLGVWRGVGLGLVRLSALCRADRVQITENTTGCNT